jgi:hypothetical protein
VASSRSTFERAFDTLRTVPQGGLEEQAMPVVATIVSREPIAWREELVGVVAAILTDGREVRVIGTTGEALGLATRARQIFQPDDDPERVLLRLVRRSVSSYETVSKPRVFDDPLDEAAAQLADELGLPVLTLPVRVPAPR